MDLPFPELKSDRAEKAKLAPISADTDSVADKLNRLVYAGGESVRREMASRCENTLHNPMQAAINNGQAYVAGAMLGALGNLPGKLKCLGAVAGTTLAAVALKDELNPERLAKISSVGQNIWDSEENTDSKICAMQKSLAPLVLDGGSLLLGLLTGKRLRKRNQEHESESENLFERRMDGWVTKRLNPIERFLHSVLNEQKGCTTKTFQQGAQQTFHWPLSDKAKEQKLFAELSVAQQWHGEHSLAVAQQRLQLSRYYHSKGQLKESQYQTAKADEISEEALAQLNYLNKNYPTEVLNKNHCRNIKEAEKHFEKADLLRDKARRLSFDDSQKAASLYDKSIEHYRTGIALHPGERDVVLSSNLKVKQGLHNALAETGWNYVKLGDLPKAYLSYKNSLALLNKDDIRRGQRSLMLAGISYRMKFFDEAEQLYRSYLKRHPIDYYGSEYLYTSNHRDALVGITKCLVQRGKLAEAKEVGVPLSQLGVHNHEHRGLSGSWSFKHPVDEFRSTVENINRVLHETRKIPPRTKTIDLPASLI